MAKCWKYKLLMRFYKPYHIPICCVGCKYAKNNKCTRTPKERGGGELILNKYGRYDSVEFESISRLPNPKSTIFIGGDGEGYNLEVNVNQKFNWFQKKMIKWCFGFEVKEE